MSTPAKPFKNGVAKSAKAPAPRTKAKAAKRAHSPATLPRTVALKKSEVELREMVAADEAAVLAFGKALPPHDLLFLPRDISHPKVLSAWVAEVGRGSMHSVIAIQGGRVVGNVTLVSDKLSWSPHVAEIRLVILPELRGQGLGRVLAETGFAVAVKEGAQKVVAQATVDQAAAIAVFEEMGYKAEALLRNHVKDREGKTHDIVILSLDVAESEARLAQYGLTGSLESGTDADL